ncbi:MAG: MFS transporter [Candidatus Omnitrophota bacterium]|jgi:multidrug resistance protein|nr:MAG: MFS transporter [Candidatus Omnitrophota bacterium]
MKKHSPLIVVFVTVFLDLLGFGILIPLLPYVAEEYDANGFLVGLLFASYSAAQFLFAPMWGRLSDRYGRRPVILISLCGSTTGYLIFAFAGSLSWLFISRILSGIAAANISTAQAIVADILPPQERTKGMGMVGAALGLGFTFGPALGGMFVEQTNYSMPFFIAAGLSGLDFLFAFFLLPETVSLQNHSQYEQRRFSLPQLKSALTVPMIPHLLVISLIYYIAFAAMEGTLGLFVKEEFALDAKQNSYFFFLVGIIIAVIQGGVVGRLAKRFGDVNVLLIGICGVFIGLLSIVFAPSLPVFIGAMIPLAIGAGFYTPAMTSLISQQSAQEVQGGILGLNQSMASLGRIIGPLAGGTLFDWLGRHSPYVFGSILIFIAFLIVFPLKTRKNKSKNWMQIS